VVAERDRPAASDLNGGLMRCITSPLTAAKARSRITQVTLALAIG
jgi:hypothetical protein